MALFYRNGIKRPFLPPNGRFPYLYPPFIRSRSPPALPAVNSNIRNNANILLAKHEDDADDDRCQRCPIDLYGLFLEQPCAEKQHPDGGGVMQKDGVGGGVHGGEHNRAADLQTREGE